MSKPQAFCPLQATLRQRKGWNLTICLLKQQQMQNSMQDNTNALVLSISTSDQNLIPWVNDINNSQWVGNLANDLSAIAQSKGYDYFHTAEFIQSFVGGAIPYQVTPYPELQAQTVFDNGDCKDKSILLASILKNMDYKVALLMFCQSGTTTGHMAVGIVFNDKQIPLDRSASYYLVNNTKYYFAETTEPNWHIGQISDAENGETRLRLSFKLTYIKVNKLGFDP
jgi:hypothetical protein